jgi:hypothetical protein
MVVIGRTVLHVDQQKRYSVLLLGRLIGARQAEHPVRILRERRPGLLAVDDILIALASRRGLERSEVGARARLGKALAPPVVEIGDAREVATLLRLAAEGDDDRSHHVDAEWERIRRRRLLQFFAIDVLPHRRPIGAAPLDRPVRHRPTLGVEDTLPADQVFLGEVPALDHLAANRLRQCRAQERAHFVAEGIFFGREPQVHGCP